VVERLLIFNTIFVPEMKLTATIIKRLLKRKVATLMLLSASIAAFATLGDGGKKGQRATTPVTLSSKTFSLRSGYNYQCNRMFNTSTSGRYIMLNTEVTYQKGNSTYIVPLKKKLFLDKIKFNPTQVKF